MTVKGYDNSPARINYFDQNCNSQNSDLTLSNRIFYHNGLRLNGHGSAKFDHASFIGYFNHGHFEEGEILFKDNTILRGKFENLQIKTGSIESKGSKKIGCYENGKLTFGIYVVSKDVKLIGNFSDGNFHSGIILKGSNIYCGEFEQLILQSGVKFSKKLNEVSKSIIISGKVAQVSISNKSQLENHILSVWDKELKNNREIQHLLNDIKQTLFESFK